MRAGRIPGRNTALRFMALVLGLLSAGLPAVAATLQLPPTSWFVGNTGDDTNPGTPELPFLTIQRAVDAAAAGDTVRMFDGLYAGAGNFDITWSDRSLTLVSDSGNREACVIDCDGENGIRFLDTDLNDTHMLTISGLSFVKADTAIAVLRVGYAYALHVQLNLTNCSVSAGNFGVVANGCLLNLDTSAFSGNSQYGVGGGPVFGVTMSDCTLRGNGVGLSFVQMNSEPAAIIDGSVFVANGVGISYWQESCGMTLRTCRVDSSSVGDGLQASSDYEPLVLESCRFIDNKGHGIANRRGMAITATGCVISGNGRSGIAMDDHDAALRLDDVSIVDNEEWGIGRYVQSQGDLVAASGKMGGAGEKDPMRDISIANCSITGNVAGGASLDGTFDPILVRDSTIARNIGVGLLLNGRRPGADLDLQRITVVANHGSGVEIASGQWAATQVLVTHNQGVSIVVADSAVIELFCVDLFGNAGGDWMEPLLPQFGIGGNRGEDPIYCDLDAGDYTLRADSPVTAAHSGCGTIGRLDWACPAPPKPFHARVRDVPGDQGYFMEVVWPRHLQDAAGAIIPVVEYRVQRDHGCWLDIATVAAAQADSYSVVVATADVMFVGQPAPPHSRYRIVACASLPDSTYASLPDSGCSIDNLPPPRPLAMLSDGPGYRELLWSAPDITDLALMCVFRGTESGFVPDTPIACVEDFQYIESPMGSYFYRVQFTDIHGNVSEFSDELHGQFVAWSLDVSPNVVTLHPSFPNPFNPETSIVWELPLSGRVRVSVFDLSGRRVRVLLEDDMPAGRHEVVWDGRDGGGMRVASGSYVARLECGGESRTIMMGLVK